MLVAVTGGTGFIGGYVVAALCAAGHTPRCLVRPTSDTSRIAHLRFERAPGDVLDAEAMTALVAGCDAVIHLALSAGWDQMRTPEQLQRLLRTSERGTRNVLDAAKAAGNVRVVFVSSVAVRAQLACVVLAGPGCAAAHACRARDRPSTAAARRAWCSGRTRRRRRWRARWGMQH
jgi:nucleoside-diphosphate-sugar epimerase